MRTEFHLSDQEMIQAADGELSGRRKAAVEAHLEACWSCRERMLSLQSAVADFVRARNRELSERIPDAEGPRALLRARLAGEFAQPATPSAPTSSSRPRFPFPTALPGRLLAGGAFFALMLGVLVTFEAKVNAEGPKPRTSITPGEVRPITLAEVCGYERAETISRDIPEDKQRQVFAMYGIKPPNADRYEVDYLITPDLGGTESTRNLWPQPYSARWNAHVKDRLEERLHEMVCSHKLDLATAQHDIATDWIGAYKKYVGQRVLPDGD